MPVTEELREIASDSFIMRQFRAGGLSALAGKVLNGLSLDIVDAITMSRVSLPLLAKLVQLRPQSAEVSDFGTEMPVDRIAAMPETTTHIGQPLADWESFCGKLIAIREECSSSDASAAWYPALTEPLDRDSTANGSYTGAEVLRAIALARLVLPENVEVRAPLATLGPKLAQVALSFGASHLGFVAVDGQSPNDPLMADPLVLDELLGDCVFTTSKDD